MDTRRAERLAVTRRLLELLRNHDYRSSFDATNRQGEHYFIPVLPEDTVAYAFQQVHEADGPAYVVLSDGPELAIAAVTPKKPFLAGATGDDDCPINLNASVGILFDLLRARRGRPTHFRRLDPGVELELIDGCPPLQVAP